MNTLYSVMCLPQHGKHVYTLWDGSNAGHAHATVYAYAVQLARSRSDTGARAVLEARCRLAQKLLFVLVQATRRPLGNRSRNPEVVIIPFATTSALSCALGHAALGRRPRKVGVTVQQIGPSRRGVGRVVAASLRVELLRRAAAAAAAAARRKPQGVLERQLLLGRVPDLAAHASIGDHPAHRGALRGGIFERVRAHDERPWRSHTAAAHYPADEPVDAHAAEEDGHGCETRRDAGGGVVALLLQFDAVPLRVRTAPHGVGRAAGGTARTTALGPGADQVARGASAVRIVALLPRPNQGVVHAAAVIVRLTKLRLSAQPRTALLAQLHCVLPAGAERARSCGPGAAT
eukprot:scaffold28988_cov73-Phaeocystis_antarctica.AAC.2